MSVTLVWSGDLKAYTAEYDHRRYRFLMSDGRTIDVIGFHDDHYLRQEVLAVAERTRARGKKGELRIEGHVCLPEVEEPELWEEAST